MQNMDPIVPVIGNMVHQGADGNQSVIDKAGIDGVEDADSLIVVHYNTPLQQTQSNTPFLMLILFVWETKDFHRGKNEVIIAVIHGKYGIEEKLRCLNQRRKRDLCLLFRMKEDIDLIRIAGIEAMVALIDSQIMPVKGVFKTG